MMRHDDLVAAKKYIEIQYSDTTQDRLRRYCIENDFDLSVRFNGREQPVQAFDFHTTVWFTTNAVLMPVGSKRIQIDDVVPTGFALFGENENILVLEIESQKLTKIRETFGKLYKLEDEWPDYRPHISLSYAYNEDSLPIIELLEAPLFADEMHVKNQKR